MALLDTYNQKATNASLRNKVAAAIAAAIWAVFEESPPVEARIAWAKDSIGKVEALANDWMWAVVGNIAVQTANYDPADGDIAYIVGVLRDKFAV